MASLPFPELDLTPATDSSPASIVLAGGCFWCTEAVFLPLDGVLGVALRLCRRHGRDGQLPGGVQRVDRSCRGDRGAATTRRESTLGRILQVFFAVAHDPTQLNRQGHDMGRQYRSAIFYRTPEAAPRGRGVHRAAEQCASSSTPRSSRRWSRSRRSTKPRATTRTTRPGIRASRTSCSAPCRRWRKLRDSFAPLLKSDDGT